MCAFLDQFFGSWVSEKSGGLEENYPLRIVSEKLNQTIEGQRVASSHDNTGWRYWGPYMSERQWGTVREDYSAHGDAWNHLSYDDSRRSFLGCRIRLGTMVRM